MVNRESIPLILALLVPFALLLVILMYYYGYDLTVFLKKVPILYYIVMIPIGLGFIVAIVKYMRPD